jgi:hypothetical protein
LASDTATFKSSADGAIEPGGQKRPAEGAHPSALLPKLLNNHAQGLQLAKELLGHPIPPFGLGDRAVTCEHGEQHDSIAPHKEPHFLPPMHGFSRGEVEIRIFALQELDVKEVVPQVEVGVNSHEGLARSHKSCDMQDPQGGQVVQL